MERFKGVKTVESAFPWPCEMNLLAFMKKSEAALFLLHPRLHHHHLSVATKVQAG
jgi:hypothetical protein